MKPTPKRKRYPRKISGKRMKAARAQLRSAIRTARAAFPLVRIRQSGKGFSTARAAAHEAGHALVVLALGGTVWGAVASKVRGYEETIGVDGITIFTFPAVPPNRHRARARRVIAAAAAGFAADKSNQISAGDLLAILSEAPKRSDKMQLLARGKRWAERILRKHDKAHAAIAEALEARGYLSRASLLNIVRKHAPRIAVSKPTVWERRWYTAAVKPNLPRLFRMIGQRSPRSSKP